MVVQEFHFKSFNRKYRSNLKSSKCYFSPCNKIKLKANDKKILIYTSQTNLVGMKNI